MVNEKATNGLRLECDYLVKTLAETGRSPHYILKGMRSEEGMSLFTDAFTQKY